MKSLVHCKSSFQFLKVSSSLSRSYSSDVKKEFPGFQSIQPRRVVVTGMGLVTPLGTGVQNTWKRLIDGDCGITKITQFDVSSLPSKVAAFVPKGTGEGEFDVTKWVPKEIRGSISPFIEYAISAANQAIDDAKWKPTNAEDQERTGVAIGAGIGSLEDVVEVNNTFQTQGYRRVTPYFVPKILINLASGHISIMHGFKGPNHAAATACATGAHAIGDAFRMIRFGDADVMVAGGTEAAINPLAMAGFCRAKALAGKFNETPKEASRPFDKDRDGFVIGEGAGVVVLEEYSHAVKRGAKIYCEIRGYGLSGDAHHITAPSNDGNGAMRAMKAAIAQSGLTPSDIDYINAHATSTPLGDVIETRAIKSLFGEHAYKLAVSSTKGAIGHLLGAAGSVEAIFSILSIVENIVPPTINLHNPDPECDLNYVPLKAQKRNVHAALSNSFGFGGTNASLVFARMAHNDTNK